MTGWVEFFTLWYDLFVSYSKHEIQRQIHAASIAASICDGFLWDRVSFLHSNYYEAVLGICSGNSVDNTEMFLLLLNRASTAFSLSHSIPPARRLGVSKKLHNREHGIMVMQIGNNELIPCIVLLSCTAFTLFVLFFFSQPMSFHTQHLLFLSPYPAVWWMSKQLYWV